MGYHVHGVARFLPPPRVEIASEAMERDGAAGRQEREFVADEVGVNIT